MDRQRLSELHAKAAQARQDRAATSTSAAKVYEPRGLEGTSLGRTQGVQQPFNAAARNEQPQQQTKAAAQQQAAQGVGSRMVARDAPRLNMNPPQHLRAGPDRQSHNQQLAADQRRALAANEQLKARRAQAESAKMKNGQERGRDRD